MLDIKLIRKERKKIEELIARKEPGTDLSALVALDDQLCALITSEEQLRARRNELSEQIGALRKEGKETAALMEEVKAIGHTISNLDHEMQTLSFELNNLLAHLPNLPMEDIKVSPNPQDNVIVKIVGEKPQFNFSIKNHVELNEKLHLFDFERAAKLSGSNWPAYRGMGARLEWALLNYMIDVQLAHGFIFWMPPLLVRQEILFGSGQIPKFEGQYYEVAQTPPLYLVPTAEVALNGLHADEILPYESLPLKYMAYTPCFRREAGASGEKERGLIRMHQFNKVEMFIFSTPEKSDEMMEEMIAVAENILAGLGLHYRLALLVTGDMSFTAAKTLDVEVWLPGQNRYYEVSSISNCTDYQARRSRIRYKKKGEKNEWVHTLNGSGLATSRLMVALLENNQREDGTVELPAVLQQRLGVEFLTADNCR